MGSLYSDHLLPDDSDSGADSSSDSLPDLEGSTMTPVSSQCSQNREGRKKTSASVPVVGAKVQAWTTGKTGGPGKKNLFKVPKKLPTPIKKVAGKSKKKTVSKEDSGSREKEGREDVAMPGKARDARALARVGVKRPLFSSSPTTVVKRIALQASKQRYQATMAQERPFLLPSPSPVSSSQSPRHLQPGPSTAPVTVHDRNCRCLYSTNKSNHCPHTAMLHFGFIHATNFCPRELQAIQKLPRYLKAKPMLQSPGDAFIRSVSFL